MMRFEVSILGSNAALPTYKSFTSSQFLNIREHYCLIDCGEGCQIAVQRYQVKAFQVKDIFISHLHGDHVLGLMGLLMSFGLNQRQKKLRLYGPKGIREWVEVQMRLMNAHLSYPLEIRECDSEQSELLLDTPSFQVFSLPLAHRVACQGFLFKEKLAHPNMRKDRILELEIPFRQIPAIKAGGGFTDAEGKFWPHEELCTPPPPPRTYAYCSDTAFHPPLAELIRGVDLLYHEATFLHELLKNAKKTGHSTAKQAGEMAKLAQVKKLLIGHFSTRYQDTKVLLEEAQSEFAETATAEEGKTYSV